MGHDNNEKLMKKHFQNFPVIAKKLVEKLIKPEFYINLELTSDSLKVWSQKFVIVIKKRDRIHRNLT